MKEFTTVFFDAGNTLFRESPLRWEIYARAGREAGLSVEAEPMRRAMVEVHDEMPVRVGGHFRYTDRWFTEYIPRIFARFGAKPEQIPGISERLFSAFRRPEIFKLFPETTEVLEALERGGVRMAVISNWSPRLPGLCKSLGLDRYLRFVLSSAIEELEKPDPALFGRALTMVGARPEEAIHVGDSIEKDVQGAAAAGILGVLLDRDGRREAPPGATRIGSLRELVPILEKGIAP